MKIIKAIASYVSYKQSLGVQGKGLTQILKRFSVNTGVRDLEKLKPHHISQYLIDCCSTGSSRYCAYVTLDAFFCFLIARERLSRSPMPDKKPSEKSSFKPYIYSQEEIKRLLELTPVLKLPWRTIRVKTLRVMLILIYGAGLRIGEAVRLKKRDVNLKDRLIMIHETKFYKSRLIPIGRHLKSILREYNAARSVKFKGLDEESPFFLDRKGRVVRSRNLTHAFKILLHHAGIHRHDQSRYGPRIHDLRHSFAVHRLISWYREANDVQKLLPALSTYLGHSGIEETKVYLSMTPELLSEANKRFEAYILQGDLS